MINIKTIKYQIKSFQIQQDWDNTVMEHNLLSNILKQHTLGQFHQKKTSQSITKHRVDWQGCDV
jgi:hypothetical protein